MMLTFGMNARGVSVNDQTNYCRYKPNLGLNLAFMISQLELRGSVSVKGCSHCQGCSYLIMLCLGYRFRFGASFLSPRLRPRKLQSK
jgi:hypothetical protein